MNRFHSPHALTKALAPRDFSEVRGQPAVVAQLKAFAVQPYATAFLFHGATGTGKNCTGRVLAGALGCVIEGSTMSQQCGGYWDLCGATLKAADVQDRLRSCHYGTLAGSGWKCIVISEADKLPEEGRTMLLFAIENLPERAVFILTTNELETMDRRLTTRCEPIEFESRVDVQQADANAWLRQLWREAGQRGHAPTVQDLPTAVQGGHLSYRALVMGLQSKLRMAA